MSQGFDLKILSAAYDRGHLVPFIGSGMSTPICSLWEEFVQRLEAPKGGQVDKSSSSNLVQRALFVIQNLRRQGQSVASAIDKAIYLNDSEAIPSSTVTLASVFWPLICTTNYDDIYLRAKLKHFKAAQPKHFEAAQRKKPRKWEAELPRILGRSEEDCRHVLQHLALPTSEVVWALQGFLGAKDGGVRDVIGEANLHHELVVGHAEYRKTAHRAPHFRRCFAELFRTRSFIFLGSGLAEPYFLTLFDEIIELTGPPARPHFAVVEEGKLDPEFMRQQYHIICRTYPKCKHECVSEFLRNFCDAINENRVRPSAWTFQVSSPRIVERQHCRDHFKLIRGVLPAASEIPNSEVVAISCGRKKHEGLAGQHARRGRPLKSPDGKAAIGLRDGAHEWRNDYVVEWKSLERSFGIIARELIDPTEKVKSSSRDRRNPHAVLTSFREFLDLLGLSKKFDAAHVQLLGAGQKKVFHPWVSLLQMARAYGQWFKGNDASSAPNPVCVSVYIADPSIVALMAGGYLDIVEQLDDAPFRVSVEIVDAEGRTDWYHEIRSSSAPIADLCSNLKSGGDPHVYARPNPTLEFQPRPLNEVLKESIREFGLVSGSTLVIDYRSRAGRESAIIPHRTT